MLKFQSKTYSNQYCNKKKLSELNLQVMRALNQSKIWNLCYAKYKRKN